MGLERVLQTAARLIVASIVVLGATTNAMAAPRERVAVIDLGPDDPAIRQRLAAAIVAGGLEPVRGDGDRRPAGVLLLGEAPVRCGASREYLARSVIGTSPGLDLG